jgi:hypothetical protein
MEWVGVRWLMWVWSCLVGDEEGRLVRKKVGVDKGVGVGVDVGVDKGVSVSKKVSGDVDVKVVDEE